MAILDSTLLGEIQEMLVEPNDLGLTWPSGLWSTSEVIDYLNQRQLRFLQETHAVVTRSTQGIIPATPRQPLPQTWIATRRIAFQPVGFDLQNGLVSFWRLNEATGLPRADSIGTATLSPNNAPTGVAGKIEGATNFSRALSQNLASTNAALLEPGVSDFSISFWVRLTSLPGVDMYLVGKGATFPFGLPFAPGYNIICTAAGKLYIDFGAPPSNNLGGSFLTDYVFSSGVWTNVTVTFARAGNITAYVNGVSQVGSDPLNGPAMNGTLGNTQGICTTTAVMVLGSFSQFGGAFGNYLDGTMDAVGWWNRVLSAAEVSALYNGGLGRELIPPWFASHIVPTGQNFQALSPGDQFEMDQSIPSWATSPQTRPTLYSDADPETLEVVLLPPSVGNGTLHFLFVEQPTTLTGLGVAFSVPDEFVPTLKWGVIEDMLGKVGRAHDPIRAKVASDLWDSGVFAAKALMEGFA